MISWIFFKLFFTLKNSVVNGVGWVWKFRNADWAVTNQKMMLRKFYWKWFYKKKSIWLRYQHLGRKSWASTIYGGGNLGNSRKCLEETDKKLFIGDSWRHFIRVTSRKSKISKNSSTENFSSLNWHFTCWYLIFSSSIHLP